MSSPLLRGIREIRYEAEFTRAVLLQHEFTDLRPERDRNRQIVEHDRHDLRFWLQVNILAAVSVQVAHSHDNILAESRPSAAKACELIAATINPISRSFFFMTVLIRRVEG
jgi:hypothetical protein